MLKKANTDKPAESEPSPPAEDLNQTELSDAADEDLLTPAEETGEQLSDERIDTDHGYIGDASSYPLLTHEQEILLATRIATSAMIAIFKNMAKEDGADDTVTAVTLLNYQQLCDSWKDVERKATSIGVEKPAIDVLFMEARQLRRTWKFSHSSAVISYLKRGKWGVSEEWSDLSSSVLKVFSSLYFLTEDLAGSILSHYSEQHSFIPPSEWHLSISLDESVLRRNEIELHELAEEAKTIYVRSNVRLVVSVAKQCIRSGIQFQDLVQEGNVGLLQAIMKYDHTKGYRFSTYATWWIRQEVRRIAAEQAHAIRIPVHIVGAVRKIIRTQQDMVQRLGREPKMYELVLEFDFLTPAETKKVRSVLESSNPGYKLSQELFDKWSEATNKLQNMMQMFSDPISLEMPVKAEEPTRLMDFLVDKSAVEPQEAVSRELLREQIKQALEFLTDRERKVLELRFGLQDGKGHTLEEIGRILSLTRERIRQIESGALKKLRHPNRSHVLRDHLL